MTERNATEIRAMLDRIAETNSVNTYLGRFLAYDVFRLLDAATGLYKIALWLAAQEGRKLTEHEAHEIGSYLNGLAWLADSPEVSREEER